MNHDDLERALQHLQSNASYELASEGAVGDINPSLYPIYFRGITLLADHRGTEAAAEFQKIIDHRGIVLNSPPRSTRTSPNRESLRHARRHRQDKGGLSDFLSLWKDADPDIPILKQAKAEHAKLQ